jgi:hypothetical protein
VLTTVAYLLFYPGRDRCWPAVQQLSPDYFPDQIETQRTRFFGNGSQAISTMRDRQNHGNHICFFCIALADCSATYLEQFLSINYRVNIVTMPI